MQRRRLLALGPALAALWLPAACSRRESAKAFTPLPAEARVLALGDSLTFGQGARPEQSWPAVLAGLTGWRVHNAGRNGDTTADGLTRLPGLLEEGPWDAILIGLGGNDMLRRMPAATTRANLLALAQRAKAHTAHSALIATPEPSAGAALMGLLEDAAFYREVADEAGLPLIASAYATALSDEAQRSDRIHANAAGYRAIGEAVHARLKELGWR